MHSQELVASIQNVGTQIRSQGVVELHIYGSVARDEHTGDSDLDVFVTLDPDTRFSLINLSTVALLLEDVTGLKVDITTRDALNQRLSQQIEAEAIRVV
ncbi:MAG: nucleotidyltransferase domain-containing protein [Pseudomonadota bacterium]